MATDLTAVAPCLVVFNGGSSSIRFAVYEAADTLRRRLVPTLGARAAYVQQEIRDKLLEHKQDIETHGEDMPEIRNWKWSTSGAIGVR